MKLIHILLASALLALFPVAALAGPTTPELLGGLPGDYDILAGGIPVNRKTGEMGRAGNVNGYIFLDQRSYIRGAQFQPGYPVPGCTAPAPPAEHPLIAKLRAAGIDPDKLAAALK